jgi:hypothetical protein
LCFILFNDPDEFGDLFNTGFTESGPEINHIHRIVFCRIRSYHILDLPFGNHLTLACQYKACEREQGYQSFHHPQKYTEISKPALSKS